MNRLQMAEEALADFKKFKSSKKCRHYKNIIHFLKTVPSGFSNQNKITEFKDFLPIEMRRGIKLEKVVELILQFYVGYSEAMKSEDVRKHISKINSKKSYRKNKKTRIAYAKKYYKENKEKIYKRQLEYQQENKDKIRFLQKEWKQKNKDKVMMWQKEWRQKNKDKIKQTKRKMTDKKRFYSINERRMSKGLDPIL